MKKRNATTNFLINNGMYIVFLAMFIFFATTEEAFFSKQNMVDVLRQLSFIALIATGMTLVIITGGIDLSVGSIVAFTGVVFALMVQDLSIPGVVAVSLVVTMVIGSLTGTINGIFIVYRKVPPFIATLAMMTIARGLARYIAENTKIFIESDMISGINALVTSSNVFDIPVLVILMLVVVGVFGIILFSTRFGRYVIATGGNEEAARLSGINVGAVKIITYTLIAALSSLVGIMMACKFGCGNPESGVMWELDAIAACVVGGTSLMGGKGNVFKTLVGALFIGVLDNGLNIKALSSEMIYIIKGVIILGAVIIDQVKE